jgi:hypothetical protein
LIFRKALPACLAAALLVGTGMYLHRNAPPACTSDEALGRVYATLRDHFHLESVFLNDIRTLSGGFFSDHYDCSAEVTEIRGNIAASDMSWRAVRYRIARQETAPDAAVTVELGGSVPLAPKQRTLWQRVLAYL